MDLSTLVKNSECIIDLGNGQKLRALAAVQSDVTRVTNLIHNCFEQWKEEDLKLSPMFQTAETTRKHLVGKGFIVKNNLDEIVSTFSLDIGKIEYQDNSIKFFEGDDTPVPYNKLKTNLKFSPNHSFLVFKKLAVDPTISKIGLGLKLYDLAESIAKQSGFAGMILETVEEAKWLYNWYLRLNFTTIGFYRYPNSTLNTILMIKPFEALNEKL